MIRSDIPGVALSQNEMNSSLIEDVAKRRADETRKDIRKHFPEATVKIEIIEGRGIVTACNGRFVVSKEYIETEESLCSAHCMREYRRVLQAKARLVIVVPKKAAASTFTRMLELNNWWLFYYLVFYYDNDGNIRRMDRRTWCEMIGRPYEAQHRAPEIA
jgi:hypothetical protein